MRKVLGDAGASQEGFAAKGRGNGKWKERRLASHGCPNRWIHPGALPLALRKGFEAVKKCPVMLIPQSREKYLHLSS